MKQNTSLFHISKTRSFLTPLASLNVGILCSLPDIHITFNYITGMIMYVQNDYYYSNVNFLCTDIFAIYDLTFLEVRVQVTCTQFVDYEVSIQNYIVRHYN